MVLDINAVNDGLAVAKGISDFGLLVIAAAFFIIVAIINQIVINRRYTAMQEKNDERYNDLFNKVINRQDTPGLQAKTEELIEHISALLEPLRSLLVISQSDVKEECTLPQSIKVVKGEVSLMRYQIINLVRQIIKRNNVHGNEKQTREKCRKVVENSFRSASSTSSMFKFKGVKLGTLYPVAYKDIIVDTIYEFIMTEGQKNYEKFDTDMCVIFDEFCSKILESVNAL